MTFIMAALAFASCASLDYDARYTQGGGVLTMPVDNIEIDWVSGMVDIQYHDSKYTEFFDDGGNLNRNYDMYHWYDGSTLRIKYGSSFGSHSGGNKRMTVLLPMGTKYRTIRVNTVSADVVADVDCDFFKGKSVSGDVTFLTLIDPVKVDVTTVSGNVLVSLPEKTGGYCSFTTVSGRLYSDFLGNGPYKDFYFGKDGFVKMDIETVSGDLDIARNAPVTKSGSVRP